MSKSLAHCIKCGDEWRLEYICEKCAMCLNCCMCHADSPEEFRIHPEELEDIIEAHESGKKLTKEEITKLIKTVRMFHKMVMEMELQLKGIK